MELKERINEVVQARQQLKVALEKRHESYSAWEEANMVILDNESNARTVCQGLEAELREATIADYALTGNKSPEVGLGIRVKTCLAYEGKDAMEWAVEHKLALRLDTSSFEKIAKTNNLPFVTITEEPSATIATELQVII